MSNCIRISRLNGNHQRKICNKRAFQCQVTFYQFWCNLYGNWITVTELNPWGLFVLHFCGLSHFSLYLHPSRSWPSLQASTTPKNSLTGMVLFPYLLTTQQQLIVARTRNTLMTENNFMQILHTKTIIACHSYIRDIFCLKYLTILENQTWTVLLKDIIKKGSVMIALWFSVQFHVCDMRVPLSREFALMRSWWNFWCCDVCHFDGLYMRQ